MSKRQQVVAEIEVEHKETEECKMVNACRPEDNSKKLE